MEPIHFLLSYIPFWAVPLFLISAEYGYTYWLKSFQRISYFFWIIASFCALLIIYYFIAGGPERSVLYFVEFTNSLSK